MITNITLENFKCFRHVSINPKLLTVLIGPNGTGKSSILQALLLLKQSVGEEQIQLQGEFVRLVSPDEIVPNFLKEPLPIQFRLEGNVDGAEFQYTVSLTSDLAPTRGSALPKPHTSLGVALNRLRATLPSIRYSVQPKHIEGYKSSELLSELLEKVTGTGLLAETEGDGASVLVPLLRQLIMSESGATILIEEPEIHLHPKAQAELAEVLAETAKAEDKQIIMTTHSEYITQRLLTLVSEKRISQHELVFYTFEKDSKGESLSSVNEVTDRGQVAGGMGGFYQFNLDALDRHVRALMPSQ